MSNDLSIFMRGGETVLAGGKLYKDFVDLKPPLIYYLSALPQLFFGPSEFSPRLFDFLWQLATALSLYYVVRRIVKSEAAAAVSAAIYCVLYAILNSSQTYTCEGFSAIAVVWIIFLQLYDSPVFFKKNFLMGMLIGWCIALKFTLGIILFALIADDIFKNTFKSNFSGFVKKYTAVSLGILLLLMLGLSPLLDKETLDAYRDVLNYLVFYTNITPVSIQFFREALGSIAGFFGDIFSFFLFAALIVAVKPLFKRNSAENRNIVGLCILITGFFLISIIIEKRFNIYYFSRMYVPLSVLAGFGLLKVYRYLRSDWHQYSLLLKSLVVCSIIFFVPFSPLPRFINMMKMSGLYFSDHKKYEAMFERDDNNFQNYSQQKEIAHIIALKRKPGEKVFVMSIGASPIYNFLKIKNASKFAHSQFYYGNGVPESWLNDAHREVFKTTWLVVQKNDGHPILNGHGRSSFQSLQQDSVLWDYVQNNFTRTHTTQEFYIFHKNGAGR